jgi:hypothetical protein
MKVVSSSKEDVGACPWPRDETPFVFELLNPYTRLGSRHPHSIVGDVDVHSTFKEAFFEGQK